MSVITKIREKLSGIRHRRETQRQMEMQRRRWREDRMKIIALCLLDYNFDECVLAVAHCPHIPLEEIGPIAHLLYTRCGRGLATLDYALAALCGRRYQSQAGAR